MVVVVAIAAEERGGDEDVMRGGFLLFFFFSAILCLCVFTRTSRDSLLYIKEEFSQNFTFTHSGVVVVTNKIIYIIIKRKDGKRKSEIDSTL